MLLFYRKISHPPSAWLISLLGNGREETQNELGRESRKRSRTTAVSLEKTSARFLLLLLFLL